MLSLAAAACNQLHSHPPPQRSDAHVKSLADTFLAASSTATPKSHPFRNPQSPPGQTHRQLRRRHQSLAVPRRRLARRIKQIDPATISAPPLRATYAILREQLEGPIALRACRNELWTVSQFVNAWQVQDGYLVTIQPVGTDDARKDALARWGQLPKFIDNEIANLREGIKLGYTAPKVNVRITIDQFNTLLAGPISASPFDSPSARDKDPELKNPSTHSSKIKSIRPEKYRDFLVKEYLPVARESIAVSAIPNGAACYDASVRFHSSLPVPARASPRIGLKKVAEIDAEMKDIAEKSFHTSDVRRSSQNSAPTNNIFQGSRRAHRLLPGRTCARKEKVPADFGLWPKADVVIQPYPAFREKNGPNEYTRPPKTAAAPVFSSSTHIKPKNKVASNPNRPLFTKQFPVIICKALSRSKAKTSTPSAAISATAATARAGDSTERLADELHLFSDDVERLGMLSDQQLRAVRLVVDSGIHTKNWTRQQAIDYMLAHTAENAHDAVSEIDRYIIYPGQATAYMLGAIEIRNARDAAQQTMGPRFDIKSFHDRVLEDGAVPLTFLKQKIAALVPIQITSRRFPSPPRAPPSIPRPHD